MADIGAEPSMEEILSSIKRIIAEEGEGGTTAAVQRARRPGPRPLPSVIEDDVAGDEAVEPRAESLVRETTFARPAPEPPTPPISEPRPAASVSPASVSPASASATRGALDELSRVVVKAPAGGDTTLEGLVRDLLRPMLAQWLDENLPRLAEEMVAREIARITGDASR